MRHISEYGLQYLIKREGGMRLQVYDDGAGYPTVGVGHLVLDDDQLKLGDKITYERGHMLLTDDLRESSEAVRKYVSVPLEQHEFDALVIFTFNIGVNAFRRSSLVRRINAGSDKCAVATFEMQRWNKAGGKFNRGLHNRRIDTVQMFCWKDYRVDWSSLEGQIS